MRRGSRDAAEPRADWKGMASWRDWEDLELVRGRLAAGADPNGCLYRDVVHRMPLHAAAGSGSPEVVSELAALVRDVDAADRPRTRMTVLP